jgi:carboxypeptidase C (cathepsin A)
MKKIAAFFTAFLLLPFLVFTQKEDTAKTPSFEPDPQPVVTKHSLRLANGSVVNYTATTGYTILKTEEGEPRAKIFSIAYTQDGTGNPASRPLTFAFNGGPGSSSVWLHMGALGPKRIVMTDEGDATTPPYKVVDNEYTWLEYTDLVFIDPVMTGFSRRHSFCRVSRLHSRWLLD